MSIQKIFPGPSNEIFHNILQLLQKWYGLLKEGDNRFLEGKIFFIGYNLTLITYTLHTHTTRTRVHVRTHVKKGLRGSLASGA
jgi:hypothetical protein